jgi:hypothetical protein
MATVAEGNIYVGSSRIVGRIRVDPGAIRSFGGPYEPRLIIPVVKQPPANVHRRTARSVRGRADLPGAAGIIRAHDAAD